MGESHAPDRHARRAAVLGSPIAHSLSPALHRAAYASLGLDWSYEAIEVDESGLAGFLSGLDDSWAGLSLTMPLKEAVIPLLDSIDDEARLVRSVNTVLPGDRGWHGTNTDIHGIQQALVLAGLEGVPESASVLGAGATARSAIAALARLGVVSVTVCARRAEAAGHVAQLARQLGLTAFVSTLEPAEQVLDADVVVSTLPGDAGAPWSGLAAGARGALLDASYHPWPSPLALTWGSPVVASGRDMLLWQAVEQVRLMTGRRPSAERMAAALPS